MEPQKYVQQMQQETIREIELARPKYLISVAMERFLVTAAWI